MFKIDYFAELYFGSGGSFGHNQFQKKYITDNRLIVTIPETINLTKTTNVI